MRLSRTSLKKFRQVLFPKGRLQPCAMSNLDSPSATPDRYSCRVLEFEAVKDLLRGFLSGPISHNLVAELSPGDDLDTISAALERVREAVDFVRTGSRPSLGGLEDPGAILGRLRVEGVSCTAREILTRPCRDAQRPGTPEEF